MKLFFLIIIFSASLSSCGFDCDKYLNKNIKPVLISGTVLDKKKSNTGCFGNIIYRQGNNIDTLTDICYCVSDKQGLWKYIMAGDSLYKEENKIVIEVYREDTMKQFDYPCCSQ
jgi:hypothetical protein